MNTRNAIIGLSLSLMVLGILSLKRVPGCPVAGSAVSQKDKKLNTAENRSDLPSASQIQRSISLLSLMNSKDDESLFPENTGAAVEGYIFDVEQGKAEPSNCNSNNPGDWNYLLYIGDGKASRIADCVVAQITPASRKLHPEWTIKYFKGLRDKKVNVTGWMLFNYPEVKNSLESHTNGFVLKRRTAWEIHPVTSVTMDE
jgi:hypothetical protein